MGPFQRIVKNLAAMFTGRMISIIQQVIVPPIFIWRYGKAGFGEWGALYGTVAALALLNFGVQTYMNQDLAVRFQRGETQGYHARQSTALRMLLTVILSMSALALVLFALPLQSWLKLDISASAAHWTMYFLSVYVLLTILFGYFSGIFMGVALAHRGANWNNIQSLVASLGLLVTSALHLPFPVLALVQLVLLSLCIVAVLWDLRRTAPELTPSLRYWEPSAVKDILRGSSYFGLIEMSTFLTYSLPLLLLQRMVGPVAVAAFILMRTIFSMCRQVLSMFTQSMGAEITNLFGRRDWPSLSKLYNQSERVIFFLIATVNLTVLMASPVLITLWTQRKHTPGATVSTLFEIYPYVLSSALSTVISLKEHKLQFQFSTNTHVELAKVMFGSYATMVLVSLGTIHYFGVIGFLWTWFAAEAVQTVRLVALNHRLFAGVSRIDHVYLTRLAALSGSGLFATFVLLEHTSRLPLVTQSGIALLTAAVVGTTAWFLFGVREVASTILGRFTKRFA